MERYPKSYQFDDSPHIDFSNVPFWKHNFSVLFMHYYCILMPWSTAHPLRSTQKPLDAMANATETRLRQQDLCDLLRRTAFLDLGKVMVGEWSFWIILRYLPRKSDTIIWDANFWVTVPKWPVPRYAMICYVSFFQLCFCLDSKEFYLKEFYFRHGFLEGRAWLATGGYVSISNRMNRTLCWFFFLSLTSSFPSRFVPSAGSFNLIGNLKSADPPNQNRVKSIKSTDIYIYIFMPGLCPEPQPRQATHHHHHHHHHHQTLVEDLQNEDRSLTGVGELNPYWRSSMNVEV